ncbi:MAG TPA: glycoside hydrolase family 32 protein [Prolixibacteraceae bacterium]|nr:glycoside hydrolase family 32 protein [Prolixibacteraceae bacterium]
MKFPFLIFLFLIASFTVSADKPEQIFNELHRPQFHFTPEKNWQNDPNGLVFYKGEYHLFYQHNPFGNKWGYMHWGHAISTDLVHWEHLPIALYPDNDSKDSVECTAFSGSGLVDENNVTGLQSGDEKTILLFYTSQHCGQRMAYSNDKGRTWQKYEKNPIIAFDETDDARDPKVIWHEASKQYVMVLYRRPNNDEKQKGVSFYTSKNLIDWTFKNHIPGFYECPDLVELPINRRPDDKKWVLFDGDGSYVIGSFDGEKFISESPKMKSDYGANYYATQTWSNIPESDGRTIQIAWMKGGEYPGMPFNGQMTFPCELSLKKYVEGIQLIRKPVKEIEQLHEKGDVWENENLIPGLNKNLTRSVKGKCLHIIGSFNVKTADSFGFVVRLDKKNNGTEIMYNVKTQTLSCMNQSAVVEPIDEVLKLDILIDRSSIEIFANDGKVVLSSCYVSNDKADGIYLFNTGGELMVKKLEIYPMKSIWQPEK